MEKKVFILRYDWAINGESGFDNIAVYSNKESACQELQSFVADKKKTALADFFSNGELVNTNEVENYECGDDYFVFTTLCGEYDVKVYIDTFDVINDNTY